MSSDDRIVTAARERLTATLASNPDHPDYGSRWQPQVDAIRRDIPALRDHVSVLHYAQENITFDSRTVFPSDPMVLQFLEWAVENEFPQFTGALAQIPENPLSLPYSLGKYHGRVVSNILFFHARMVFAGIFFANKPKRILEIGGGYGEIARVWVKNPILPAESFIIVDIPESLFFADVALSVEFGDEVGYFDGRDPGTKILLVPTNYLKQLSRASDLVINAGMQEMTDEWVNFYMDWLSHYEAQYLYSLNYAAQPLSVLGESRNLWAPRPSPEWCTRHLRLNIPLLDLMGPTRDFLEAVYQKRPATRSLKEWSIYRGHILSKTTYVEGLDLLRQNFTVENARIFVDVVMDQMPYKPKELLYIVEWLVAQGETQYKPIGASLRRELGGELYHAPVPPAARADGASA